MGKRKPRKAVAMTASAPQKMEEFPISPPGPLTTGNARLNGIKKPTFLASVLWLNACISFAMK